jgi:hypothetical protein
LGVLGTQETFYIVIAGLFERDSFDLLLPEFNKPWVIHLRETCRSSTNLCTWRPNTVYKDRSVRRDHLAGIQISLSARRIGMLLSYQERTVRTKVRLFKIILHVFHILFVFYLTYFSCPSHRWR